MGPSKVRIVFFKLTITNVANGHEMWKINHWCLYFSDQILQKSLSYCTVLTNVSLILLPEALLLHSCFNTKIALHLKVDLYHNDRICGRFNTSTLNFLTIPLFMIWLWCMNYCWKNKRGQVMQSEEGCRLKHPHPFLKVATST